MKTFLLLIAVVLSQTLLVGQEQTPEIFGVSDVVAGGKRIDKL
jgi:hypothetical protein